MNNLLEWLCDKFGIEVSKLDFFCILVIVLILLILGGVWVLQPPKVAINEGDNCPIESKLIQEYALIIMDGTDPLLGEYADNLYDNTKNIARSLAQYGKLSLHDINTGKERRLNICSPAKPEDCDALNCNKIKFEQQYDKNYLNKVKDAVSSFLNANSEESDNSFIVQRLAEITDLSDFQDTEIRSVHIFSDMLHYDSKYSHYRGNMSDKEFDWFKGTELYKNNKLSLEDVSVTVYYLVRDKYKNVQTENHKKFWRDLFTESGAVNINFATINLPSEGVAKSYEYHTGKPPTAKDAPRQVASVNNVPQTGGVAKPEALQQVVVSPPINNVPPQTEAKPEALQQVVVSPPINNVPPQTEAKPEVDFNSEELVAQNISPEVIQAIRSFRDAAEDGNKKAQRELGRLLIKANFIEDGMKWVNMAALGGDAWSLKFIEKLDSNNSLKVLRNPDVAAIQYREKFIDSRGADFNAMQNLLELHVQRKIVYKENKEVQDLILNSVIGDNVPSSKVMNLFGRMLLSGIGGFNRNYTDAYALLMCAGESGPDIKELKAILKNDGHLNNAENIFIQLKNQERCV